MAAQAVAALIDLVLIHGVAILTALPALVDQRDRLA